MAAVQRAAGAHAGSLCRPRSVRASPSAASVRAVAPILCGTGIPACRQGFVSSLGSRKRLGGDAIQQAAALPRLPILKRRKGGIRAEAAVPAAPAGGAPPAAPPAKWEGAKMKPLAISVAVGVIAWFLPAPAGVPRNAWQLLAIFLGTVVGIITQPLPLGAVALIGLGVSILTRTLTFAAAFSAFGNEIPWLIALAFFFAKGFIKTGLGNRVAYQFVKLFGSTTLGLSYSLVFAEALLAPAIPSVSARAGGIFLPLVKAMCLACGSNVGDGTERRLGAYLMTTCFQTSVISSAMFLTGMAANPLSVNLTASVIGQTISWTTWATAAIVPGLLSLLLVPALLFWVYPPEVKESPDAPKLAEENLRKMGPMTQNEKIMAGTLLTTVRRHADVLNGKIQHRAAGSQTHYQKGGC
jgi:hypothetical protein